jgi:hypothetical protein
MEVLVSIGINIQKFDRQSQIDCCTTRAIESTLVPKQEAVERVSDQAVICTHYCACYKASKLPYSSF